MCDLASVLETCRLNGLRVAAWLAEFLAAAEGTPPEPLREALRKLMQPELPIIPGTGSVMR